MVVPPECNPGLFDRTCWQGFLRCTNKGAAEGCAGADGHADSKAKWFRCWDPTSRDPNPNPPYACYNKQADPRGHERGSVFKEPASADSHGNLGHLW